MNSSAKGLAIIAPQQSAENSKPKQIFSQDVTKNTQKIYEKSSLPLISKLDSDGDSPEPGSDGDFNLDDDDTGLNNLMSRNSNVVGASSGRENIKSSEKQQANIVGSAAMKPTSYTT